MFLKKKNFTNWGRNTYVSPHKVLPKNFNHLKKIIDKKSFIIHGNQRSYGDVALNNNVAVSMKNFNKIKFFDQKKGIIEIESGVILKDLLPKIIDKGWFIPLTPGTKYVSLGGMIANNVHGKNISKNQIKYFVKEIKLLNLKKKIIKCSKTKNKKLFNLTIGGFGLTGIILSATLTLKKISSPYLEQKIIEFKSYKEFFSISNKKYNYDYSVFWIDNFSENEIKGLNYLAKHSSLKNKNQISLYNKKIGIIETLISKLIIKNYYFSRIVHFTFRNYKKKFYKKLCHFDEVFYPQDHFIDWNKIYGNKGFFQIQFIIPTKKFKKILTKISFFLKKKKCFQLLLLLKNIMRKEVI